MTSVADRNPKAGDESRSIDAWRRHVFTASAGDHQAIYRFLRTVSSDPSEAEFQAQLDAPGYDPAFRLIVRHEGNIWGHARIQLASMQFFQGSIRAAVVSDLHVSPGLQDSGCAQALMDAVEQKVASLGAVIGISSAAHLEMFAGRGWFVGSVSRTSSGSACEVLAKMHADGSVTPRGTKTALRTWRQLDRPELVRLYRSFAQHRTGAWERDEQRWQWLIGRRGYDRILVASEGNSNGWDALVDSVPLTGYAVLRNSRIVELVASPHHPWVARELLQGIASDLLESNSAFIQYAGAPDCVVHSYLTPDTQLARAATKLFWVPNVAKLSQVRVESIRRAAAESKLNEPGDLDFDLATENLSLRCKGGTLSWGDANQATKSARRHHRIHCQRSAFCQMLLGHREPESLRQAGQLVASKSAMALLQRLFPATDWLLHSLDDQPG